MPYTKKNTAAVLKRLFVPKKRKEEMKTTGLNVIDDKGTSEEQEIIIFATLNTGHEANISKDDVFESVIETLIPLVISGGGALPEPFQDFTAIISIDWDNKEGMFMVSWHDEPLVSCGVVWGEAGEESKVWNLLVQTAEEWHLPILLSKPIITPWLVALLYPVQHLELISDYFWLADFEKCLAVTIIEMSKQKENELNRKTK